MFIFGVLKLDPKMLEATEEHKKSYKMIVYIDCDKSIHILLNYSKIFDVVSIEFCCEKWG